MLLFAERKRLQPQEVPDGRAQDLSFYQAFNIRFRGGIKTPNQISGLQTAIKQNGKIIRFKISQFQDHREGGLTKPRYDDDSKKVLGITTHIASDVIYPLLQPDLSVSERLLHQFYTAIVVSNDLHALSRGISSIRQIAPSNGSEPFVEDEAINELVDEYNGRHSKFSTIRVEANYELSKFVDLPRERKVMLCQRAIDDSQILVKTDPENKDTHEDQLEDMKKHLEKLTEEAVLIATAFGDTGQYKRGRDPTAGWNIHDRPKQRSRTGSCSGKLKP
ncbi:hypothetical protein G7Y89_g11315 [Cudoniella acicularis]|uniref:Uncharacterized protein n=1 Tax=Cudoniella acicularis TaxID=354080 RepID=A0A8H4REQ2_9HELO|nr:hypothetical protein G7Y89_g11315 [Cudoniella acicularis]